MSLSCQKLSCSVEGCRSAYVISGLFKHFKRMHPTIPVPQASKNAYNDFQSKKRKEKKPSSSLSNASISDVPARVSRHDLVLGCPPTDTELVDDIFSAEVNEELNEDDDIVSDGADDIVSDGLSPAIEKGDHEDVVSSDDDVHVNKKLKRGKFVFSSSDDDDDDPLTAVVQRCKPVTVSLATLNSVERANALPPADIFSKSEALCRIPDVCSDLSHLRPFEEALVLMIPFNKKNAEKSDRIRKSINLPGLKKDCPLAKKFLDFLGKQGKEQGTTGKHLLGACRFFAFLGLSNDLVESQFTESLCHAFFKNIELIDDYVKYIQEFGGEYRNQINILNAVYQVVAFVKKRILEYRLYCENDQSNRCDSEFYQYINQDTRKLALDESLRSLKISINGLSRSNMTKSMTVTTLIYLQMYTILESMAFPNAEKLAKAIRLKSEGHLAYDAMKMQHLKSSLLQIVMGFIFWYRTVPMRSMEICFIKYSEHEKGILAASKGRKPYTLIAQVHKTCKQKGARSITFQSLTCRVIAMYLESRTLPTNAKVGHHDYLFVTSTGSKLTTVSNLLSTFCTMYFNKSMGSAQARAYFCTKGAIYAMENNDTEVNSIVAAGNMHGENVAEMSYNVERAKMKEKKAKMVMTKIMASQRKQYFTPVSSTIADDVLDDNSRDMEINDMHNFLEDYTDNGLFDFEG